MYTRIQRLRSLGQESCFLWGPRQTGKSTLLAELFPDSLRFDLLLSEQFELLSRRPGRLREEILAKSGRMPVIIDEVQSIPRLLNEVQWLMVNKKTQFILCGSSARKLRRTGANLLGGRAVRFELFPLVTPEVPDFDLDRALNHGLLPRHYLSTQPRSLLQAYVGDYLKEEIAAEAVSRNIPAFGRFLESAAFSNGEIVNYANIASECGVSAPTARAYFEILTDTLLGRFLPSYRRRPKRRVIQAPKFFFFDVGIVNFLLRRGVIEPGSELFGKAFEHFLYQELLAHSHYGGVAYPLAYWRTATHIEVDFILGEHEVALEVKGVDQVHPHHLAGLKAFSEEYRPRLSLLVSRDPAERLAHGIRMLPWRTFLKRLWGGEIVR